ncbi:MAG: type II transport protein GspH [Oceanospirillaceae bacterium]|nr:type II transport protein GspH [Oceanospirillaceae bacterium]
MNILHRDDSKRAQTGFSLIELMISLVILGLLIGIALPNFNRFIAQRRVSSIQQNLIDTLSLARSEAVTRGERVVVCAIPAGQVACAAVSTTNTDWSGGWIVFVESTNFIIRNKRQMQPNIGISFSGGNRVTFESLGELDSIANNEQDFVITGASAITAALSLRTTGRLRTCQTWNAISGQCDDQ